MINRCIGCGIVVLALAASVAAVSPVGKDVNAGPAPILPVPVVHHVMASPRASLIGTPLEHRVTDPAMIRAAKDFPRGDRAIGVPVEARVILAHGWGGCRVRGIVSTSVRSYSRPLESSEDPSSRGAEPPQESSAASLALGTDVAHVAIRVVDWIVPSTGPHEEVAADPDVMHIAPNIAETRALSVDEDYLSDSGVFDIFDPGVFCPTTGSDIPIPFDSAYWQLKK